MANLTSPFAASASAQRLPALKIGSGKLVIRVANDADNDAVLFLKDPSNDVSAARASGFLEAGESVEICGEALTTGLASDVTIVRTSGTPNIYFEVL